MKGGRLRPWRPVLAWVALILVATTVPLPGSPDWHFDDVPVDRLVHFGLYAGLGWTLAGTLGRTVPAGPGAWLGGWSGGLVFGALDELHQIWVPGRIPSTGDWMADALGVTVGLAAWWTALGRGRRGGTGVAGEGGPGADDGVRDRWGREP